MPKPSYLLSSLSLLAAFTVVAPVAKANGSDELCSASIGTFTSQTGLPCDSPIGLCTHGRLVGEIEAQYDFTFLTMVPAQDPNDPTKFLYTGKSVVTYLDGSGVLYTEDTGFISISTDGSPAEFVTKAIAAHGDKHLRHTLGGFVASGTLRFDTGEAEGTYNAVLCSRHGKHR